jgi:N6-L-threonylcarbamoyladenine synthase
VILAIESSCDESAVACFDPEKGFSHELIHSQIDLHATYGGVVPDLASREHVARFPALVEQLKDTGVFDRLTKVAVTRGPGLAACLASGITLAKAIATFLRIPLVGVNHLQAHAYSPFIQVLLKDPGLFRKELEKLLPHLGLIVSGGNTIAVAIDEKLTITTLAETVDDAAGEAIDKGAKLLGLPYPGGPAIERISLTGGRGKHPFPVSCPKPDDMRFSFSGLKTSLRYALEKLSDQKLAEEMPHICMDYQYAIIEQLIRKASHIINQREFSSIGLSGGVSNNRYFRDEFVKMGKKMSLPSLIVEPKYTGDNASMIAFASWVNPKENCSDSLETPLNFDPSLRVDSLN